MTVERFSAPPVSVQSSKLIEWMLNRKLLQKDYPKRLASLTEKLKNLINADQSVLELSEHEAPSFLQASEVFKSLEKTDTTKDFFGRASQNVRAWRDIVDSYVKYNLHIAELAEQINELASEVVPRCKAIISDRQKLITDLRQKIKEQTLNVMKKEDLLDKACREFGMNASEENIRLHLLEEASKVPAMLNSFVGQLNHLSDAVDLYTSVREYTHRAFQDDQEKELNLKDCCPTLKLLINSGHVNLYTWKMGYEPGSVAADDDFVPSLLLEEQHRVHQSTVNNGLESNEDEGLVLDLDIPNEIQWGDDNEVGIDFDVSDDTAVEIEVDQPLGNEKSSTDIKSAFEIVNGDVASGQMARLLLDTVEGRNALLNELVELSAFMERFTEDLSELQGLEKDYSDSMGRSNTGGNAGGSSTLNNMIIQNAPSNIQSVSAKEAASMLATVGCAHAKLTNSGITQLLMIRSKPGYLDRVVGRLTDLRLQVSRAKARVTEAQAQIEEASVEQEIQAAALVKHRSQCRKLVQTMESELTQICNRQIQIIGQVLNL